MGFLMVKSNYSITIHQFIISIELWPSHYKQGIHDEPSIDEQQRDPATQAEGKEDDTDTGDSDTRCVDRR